jgi:hypothetical protein
MEKALGKYKLIDKSEVLTSNNYQYLIFDKK